MIKKFISCAVAFVAIAGLAASANAQTAVAKYDPVTGNIKLNLSSNIAVAGFEAQGSLEFNAAASGQLGAIAPAQKDAKVLAYFSATGLAQGDYTILNILPTNLVPTKVGEEFHLTQLGFSYTPVGAPSIIAPVLVDVAVIPEPATLAMAGLGMIGVVATMRRRK
jgi:hypothetical protein